MSKATDEAVVKMCIAAIEMSENASHDLCGEQREFYLPRIRDVLVGCSMRFPIAMKILSRGINVVDDQSSEQEK